MFINIQSYKAVEPIDGLTQAIEQDIVKVTVDCAAFYNFVSVRVCLPPQSLRPGARPRLEMLRAIRTST
jgi:hypothetical protein